MTDTSAPIIVCFHSDLRLEDNAALRAAAQTGRAIVPCFVFENGSGDPWSYGGASRWWLHHSLQSLAGSLSEHDANLILRHGSWSDELEKLAKETGASAVYWSRRYTPHGAEMEQDLKLKLNDIGIEAKRFAGYLLFEPESIRTQNDDPYKVFTPFWRACLGREAPRQPLKLTKKPLFYSDKLSSARLTDWDLLPTQPDWAGGLREHWQPGEQGAIKRLRAFMKRALKAYDTDRDRPAIDGTSGLSPHLHFGEISPRKIWHEVKSHLAKQPEAEEGANSFLRELGWRDFSYHLLHHWPDLPEKAFKPKFDAFPWKSNSQALKAWQRGQTGIPLVDAGMRQLWHTGIMHNRVRMIVASLLVKNLSIHWREGEEWFWDTLVDADLASNAAGWQWVAGSGADAAPYFRIFNPVTQSEKFDPEGVYLKRWLPELERVPKKYIHAPWTAPKNVLEGAGVCLGKDYPHPIVDLKQSRQQALDAYKRL